MDEDWDMLKSFFPEGWRELAIETNATKGLRQDKDAEKLLRLILLHVGCGYSLKETVVRARASGLAKMSDVALLKRLRKAEPWLQSLCGKLFSEMQLLQAPPGAAGHIRLIDASIIKEPGKTGSQWRLHYSLTLATLCCDFFEITPNKGAGTGESFSRYEARPGEHLIGDRGYSTAQGIATIVEQGADVTVRLNPQNLRVQDADGHKLDLMSQLGSVSRTNRYLDISVQIADSKNQHVVKGRICALRKSKAAIAKAREKLQQRATRKQEVLKEDTLFYAEYVMVFTTVPKERLSAKQILELYRLRWQIELVFKRFKQQAALGHLPKSDPVSSRAWLYGKLFLVLLTEKLLNYGESFSPWGYPQRKPPDLQPLEGV